MTISQTLAAADHQLAHIDDHTTIVRHLLADVLDLSQQQLWTNSNKEITPQQFSTFQHLIDRARNHEPLAYLLGYKEFYGRKFNVTPDTLIPRPETEQLIDIVLSSPVARRSSPRIIDVGTGSGCLAITLALELPQADIYAIDISDKALQVAQNNAKALSAANITFLQGSILSPVSSLQSPASIDAVVANLPYISDTEYEELPLNVKNYEPPLALRSGQHPDTINHQLTQQARTLLKQNSLLAYETTNGQIIVETI